MNAPGTAPYPEYRVVESAPFTATGIDYTGALHIRDKNVVSKVYICLYTCMVTRAIHLELVEDGTAAAFIRAFRRFTARRSCPNFILSDNAAIFSNASRYLNSIIAEQSVTDYFVTNNIQWRFIPARAPHFGGVWERLIGMTKLVLKKVLGRALVTYVELSTLLCEVESVINDRPLTHVSGDLSDEPLTPSHLLHGCRIKGLRNCGFNIEDLSDPSVGEKPLFTKREKRLRYLLDKFWGKWREEYLKSLRERDRNLIKSNHTKISVGDIVLIHDDKPRSGWNMGRVTTLHKSADGLVRSVDLKTKFGCTTRPIVKLVHLEIISNCNENESDNEISDIASRPKRQAAIEARRLISQCV